MDSLKEKAMVRRSSVALATLATAVSLLVVTLLIRPQLNPLPDTVLSDGNGQLPSILRGNDWLRWVDMIVLCWLGFFLFVVAFWKMGRDKSSDTLIAIVMILSANCLIYAGFTAVSRGWYAGLEQAVINAFIIAIFGIVAISAVAILVLIVVGITIAAEWAWKNHLRDSALGDRIRPLIGFFRADDVEEEDEFEPFFKDLHE